MAVDVSKLILTVNNQKLTLGVPITTGANAVSLGAGADVFKDKTGNLFNFRSITGSGDITVTENEDEIDICNQSGDMKAGRETAGNFTLGISTVTFATAYPDAAYTITFGIDGVTHSFAPRFENKTAAGFDINLGTTSLGGLSAVMWQTVPEGE